MFGIFMGIVLPVVAITSAIVYGYHPKVRFLYKLEEIIVISILIIAAVVWLM